MYFTWKARYIAGGHLTYPPYNIPTYASVVYCESVRILFLVAVLYNTEFLAADIRNALLNAKYAKKVCYKAVPKFSTHEGMWVIIVHDIYAPKSVRAMFRVNLANTLPTMEFKPTFPDRSVCMCKNFILLPQELNDSEVSGTGTDTTALLPAPKHSNSDPASDTP